MPREAALSINALNARLNAMSGKTTSPFWTREALAHHEARRSVRTLAVAVLIKFNWRPAFGRSVRPLSRTRCVYLGGRQQLSDDGGRP